jgi:signal transduction histidine kinase
MLKTRAELFKDEQAVDLVTKMDKQVQRLHYIIQDLTDITRIENSRIKYRENEFDLNEFLTGIIEAVQRTTQTHKFFFNSTDTVTVFADEERTSQVVTNLLNNAIKYSAGATTVNVTTYIRNDEIICSVQDFGLGIAEEQQSKIFDKFYQLSEPGKSNTGFGLGLYISAQIIKRQNGRIWVESIEGEGSIFYFSLPRKIYLT